MSKLYIITIIVTLILTGVAIYKHNKVEQPELYALGAEKHDLETWRLRGIESTKDRNTKSILRHCDQSEIVGLLFLAYGWNLTPCK